MVINYACSSVYSAVLVEVFQSYIGVIIQGKVLRTLFVIMDEKYVGLSPPHVSLGGPYCGW